MWLAHVNCKFFKVNFKNILLFILLVFIWGVAKSANISTTDQLTGRLEQRPLFAVELKEMCSKV